MTVTIISALILSLVIYLAIGFILSKKTKSIEDMLPLIKGRQATVRTSSEFSASTVATTISLATIVIAYFELTEVYGLWLLWTVLATSLGFVLLKLTAGKIWNKLQKYDHRPTLHEFLGHEFGSKAMSIISAVSTSIGFLLIFSVELIVGSRFLAAFIPQIPEWITITVLSVVGFTYTTMGGFRAVVKTDQIQMRFIWIFILLLASYIIYSITTAENTSLKLIPEAIYNFSYREGLIAFMLGIFIMNVPTHISNMSIWQRIAASESPETVTKGINSSIYSSALSWGSIVILACVSFAIITPEEGVNPLITLIKTLENNTFGHIVLFFITMGLYGAMLSTASTQMIVVSHTIYEDILAPFRKSSLKERLGSVDELKISRKILTLSVIITIGLVAGLQQLGFSIADLVFAIYGGQLVLFPAILATLYFKRKDLIKLSLTSTVAVFLGFISGWVSAIVGKLTGNSSVIFLAPAISIGTSTIIMLSGFMFKQD